jgi:hypothetical protein
LSIVTDTAVDGSVSPISVYALTLYEYMKVGAADGDAEGDTDADAPVDDLCEKEHATLVGAFMEVNTVMLVPS